MAVYFVPSIVPVDYPVFYDLCGDRLPGRFEEWRATEDQARRDLVAQGHHVIGIAIGPRDLRAHCRSANCRADRTAMGAYAMAAGGARYPNYADVRARTVVVEDTRTGRVVAADVPARRHWWNFWRRPRAAAVPNNAAIRNIVVAEEAPARRHWWQFWRRSRSVEVPARRPPLAQRPV